MEETADSNSARCTNIYDMDMSQVIKILEEEVHGKERLAKGERLTDEEIRKRRQVYPGAEKEMPRINHSRKIQLDAAKAASR